jgi:hypothetical protein
LAPRCRLIFSKICTKFAERECSLFDEVRIILEFYFRKIRFKLKTLGHGSNLPLGAPDVWMHNLSKSRCLIIPNRLLQKIEMCSFQNPPGHRCGLRLNIEFWIFLYLLGVWIWEWKTGPSETCFLRLVSHFHFQISFYIRSLGMRGRDSTIFEWIIFLKFRFKKLILSWF